MNQASPAPGAEQDLQHLAGAIAGEGIDQGDPLGELVAGELALEVAHDRAFVGPRAARWLDEEMAGLAPALVGHADDRRLGDVREFGEDGFDVSGDVGYSKADGGTKRQLYGEFLNWADYTVDFTGTPGSPANVKSKLSLPFMSPGFLSPSYVHKA